MRQQEFTRRSQQPSREGNQERYRLALHSNQRISQRLPLGGADVYEDHCCTVCNGRAHIRCPHCSGGSVSDDMAQRGMMQTPFGNVPYADTATVQRRCTFLRWHGLYPLPCFRNGYDRSGR